MIEGAYHIHLVSDATGETTNIIARACLAQFENITYHQHFWSLIRTSRQLDLVKESLDQWPGLVLYTFVDENLRRDLEEFCRKKGLIGISALDPVLKAMSGYFGKALSYMPGRQHVLDADYFARIDAMDFALAQDDGHGETQLAEADVIILGVSRTSKTPTCMYLANRGIKAANIPLVPDHPHPQLENYTQALVVGLIKDAESLVEIRRNRLSLLHQNKETSYTDPEKVQEEVLQARRFFARIGCAVIDVSRRSIEETSAEIIMMLSQKKLRDAKSGA